MLDLESKNIVSIDFIHYKGKPIRDEVIQIEFFLSMIILSKVLKKF